MINKAVRPWVLRAHRKITSERVPRNMRQALRYSKTVFGHLSGYAFNAEFLPFHFVVFKFCCFLLCTYWWPALTLCSRIQRLFVLLGFIFSFVYLCYLSMITIQCCSVTKHDIFANTRYCTAFVLLLCQQCARFKQIGCIVGRKRHVRGKYFFRSHLPTNVMERTYGRLWPRQYITSTAQLRSQSQVMFPQFRPVYEAGTDGQSSNFIGRSRKRKISLFTNNIPFYELLWSRVPAGLYRKKCKAIKKGPFMQQVLLLWFGHVVSEQEART